jgi:hypothetical protein
MARLRCGLHELEVSERRRLRKGRARLEYEERVCEWCERRMRDADMVEVAKVHSVPLGDEEHALLFCGLYRQLRAQLDRTLTALTGGTDQHGRLVCRQGVVRLARMLDRRSVGEAEGDVDRRGTVRAEWGLQLEAALAVVMGGLHCGERVAHGAPSDADRRIDDHVRQACTAYVGAVMQKRREWRRSEEQETSTAVRGGGGGAAGAGRDAGAGRGGSSKLSGWQSGCEHLAGVSRSAVRRQRQLGLPLSAHRRTRSALVRSLSAQGVGKGTTASQRARYAKAHGQRRGGARRSTQTARRASSAHGALVRQPSVVGYMQLAQR